MMGGQGELRGIIPRVCEEIFQRAQAKKSENVSHRVEVTYIEIYAERIRDLLNNKCAGNLRVREHPQTGLYVYKYFYTARGRHPCCASVSPVLYSSCFLILLNLYAHSHSSLSGPYVEGVTTCAVESYQQLESFMILGTTQSPSAQASNQARNAPTHSHPDI